MAWSLRDKACIVGVGNTEYGAFPNTNAFGLGLEALDKACRDAGVKRSEIDALIVSRIPEYDRLAEMGGLSPQYSLQLPSPGRFSAIALMTAATLIAAGEASVVALVYGNDGKSNRAKYGGGAGPWSPWGMTSPGAIHALMWQRHMHLYGSQSKDLAVVASTFRKHASLNPQAVMREPFTVEDHQRSRPIVAPLRLFDYCLINDGGVAWIMTSADKAKELAKPPVFVSGFSRRDSLRESSIPNLEFWAPALNSVASEVYDRAGIGREEVSGLMIYDNFTPTVMFSLEGMGFCRPGESGDFVADGHLSLFGGDLPTNTSGGHLSESYMQGWALINESVRQLRGECGERQIAECNVIQYVCATNCASSVILRR